MAKIGFTKVTPIREIKDKTIDINGNTVTVKQYLPIAEKSQMMTDMISHILDEKGVYSPLRQEVYFKVFLVQYYSNISFTETMLMNIEKTYDLLKINGISDEIIKAIPEQEFNELEKMVIETLKAVNDYRISFAGVLETVQNNSNTEGKNIDDLFKELELISQNDTLKGVMEKLG